MRRALLVVVLALLSAAPVRASEPVRVVIVGLVHGHVKGFLRNLPDSHDAKLVGIVEPDTGLALQYEQQYKLDHALFHTDLDEALRTLKPDAVLVYTIAARSRPLPVLGFRPWWKSRSRRRWRTQSRYATQRAGTRCMSL